MDFQSLSRRELQALCKKNKIPANMTNVAMADALAALSHVEGLEELGKDLCETPLRQTASRTTTRRKPAMEQEPEGSIQSTRTCTRRVMSKAVSEKTDEEENVNINSLQTPAAPTTRRRATAATARTKLATENVEKKKAPAATGQSAYSTRRSTRLLEKTMADLTLTDKKTSEPNAIDEEAPKEVNMTEKETFKPIKMEELHAESDMSKGFPDEDEENKDIEDVKSCVVPETESKREVVDVPDLEEATKEETLDNGAEENKGIEDVKSSVIPETESKREVVDVPHLDEATKEETLDNGAEQNKDDTAATNVSDVVDDAKITAREGVERDSGSGEELLLGADDSSEPSHDKLVEEETEMMEVETEDVEKSFPDVEEVEESADLEVTDNQTIVAVENASEEDQEGEKSLPKAEEVEEEEAMDDDETIVAPECVNVIAAENANDEDEEGEKSLSDEEEVEEAADLEVLMDDQTIAAPNANDEDEEGEKSLSDVEEVEKSDDLEVVMDDQTIVAPQCNIAAENANEEDEEGEKSLPDADEVEEADDQATVAPQCNNVVADENANNEDEAIQLPITAATSVSTPPSVASVKKMKEKESGKEELLLQVYADPESVAANNTTPAAAASVQKMRIPSPYSAPTLKSSSKKNQSALVDVNKENNQIHQSGRQVVEPLAATAANATAVDVVIPKKKKKCLEDESLRKLSKMLKEKLVLNNKEDGDEARPANLPPKKQQQQGEQMMAKRQALQKLPENLQAVGDAAE